MTSQIATEVLVVLYQPEPKLVAELLRAVAREASALPVLRVRLRRNDARADVEPEIEPAIAALRELGIEVSISVGDNLGFGQGVNVFLAELQAPFVLLLNQDAIPEPGSFLELRQAAEQAKPEVAAFEMRQIPYEHPKAYDPVSLDTEWVSAAAVMLRTEALQKVGGFEPRIFMYGEDVDLSWRLRCSGYKLQYVPRAAVVHRTYERPEAIKPLQALEGIYVNLCLRTRYAGRRQVLQGLTMAWGECLVPQSFPGRRMGILRAVARFFRNYRYFRRTQQAAPGFEPRFAGWGYEIRRDGAFHPFKSQAERKVDQPLVSILIRTHNRPAFLREALRTCANQTYRPLEVIVVEDGTTEGEAVCAEFSGALDIHYSRLHPAQGRSRAGNQALAQARGEWLCFLDDDDVLFADHIEVLVDTVLSHALKGAYALAWRVKTKVLDPELPLYQELMWERFPDEPFNRVSLWHHNFMPIQSVLFHRSLYETYGGFDESMVELEDWNLWTRYTLRDDFIQVRKLTSKYRVPADASVSAQRQQKLDQAYEQAVAKQKLMRFEATPELVRELARQYQASNTLLAISRDEVRFALLRSEWLRKLFSYRELFRKRLRAKTRSSS